MEQEEIIAIAIREAFKCGKEEGEAYQRMWSNMNEKIEKAKKGEPDKPIGMYDGFFSQLQGMQGNIDPAKPGTESEEVTIPVQAVPGNRIGSEPNEQIAALEKEVNELGRICEEKDATITELREELKHAHAPAWMLPVDAKALCPEPMQRCLCYDKLEGGWRCYVYDNISKYWCTQSTTEHDPDGDNHVSDYADYRITCWMPLPFGIIKVITKEGTADMCTTK